MLFQKIAILSKERSRYKKAQFHARAAKLLFMMIPNLTDGLAVEEFTQV